MNLNKTMLIGRVTKDPEVRALPSGVKVCSFSLATNRTWKDKNGAKQEDSEFHNIVAFAKTAEIIGQYVKKGQEVYVEGRLQTRSWEDKDNKKMYRTEIVIENFQFGSKPQGSANHQTQQQDEDTVEYPEEDNNPDDIPF